MKISILLNKFTGAKGGNARIFSKIGDKTVQFARVKRLKNKIELLTYVKFQLDANTSSVLSSVCTSLNMENFQYGSLLAPSEYQLQIVDAPNVPAEELKAAIRWRVKDTLNYPVDEATLDVIHIPANKNTAERSQSLYVVTASNEVIKKRMFLFENAKLNLNVIDIPEMAQRNIAALFEDEGRALALLAFDDHGGMLTFTCDGELYMSRRIDISLSQLNEADENLHGMSIERLELEVQRSLDYFDRQFSFVTVSRLLVCAPLQSGLLEKLSGNLSVPVERLDLSQVMNLTVAPDLADIDAQVEAFHVLGAALRQEGAVQ